MAQENNSDVPIIGQKRCPFSAVPAMNATGQPVVIFAECGKANCALWSIRETRCALSFLVSIPSIFEALNEIAGIIMPPATPSQKADASGNDYESELLRLRTEKEEREAALRKTWRDKHANNQNAEE
jgi:hypothetical protein